MPLIFSSDFEGLPLEPVSRWLALRDLVEKRISDSFDMREGYSTSNLVEYCSVLRSAALELGLGELPEPSISGLHENIEYFRSEVAALATRLSLRSNTDNLAQTVALARPTRRKILIEIENLRSKVENSELPESQKTKAAKKIDQLHTMIVSPRTDIARVGFVLAGIGAFAVGTTSLLADLPQAIGTISALVGADKMEEEDEQVLIERDKKRLQIEHRREEPTDDEIPF